jgi:hypothetical protein
LSFQLFLPFGPPTVPRLEVAAAVNDTNIHEVNLSSSEHSKKSISMMNQELTVRKRPPIKAF